MKRVMIVYPNGKITYGWFDDAGGEPYFVFANVKYAVKDVLDTGATVTTNNPDLEERLKKAGVPVNRTEKQHTMTISVQEDTKTRLHTAARALNRSVSNILEELARKWLGDNGY